MNIQNMLPRILVFIFLTVSTYSSAAVPLPDGTPKSDMALRLHLFDPVAQHANKGIHEMFARAHDRMTAEHCPYEVALMKELKAYLLGQIASAAADVAKAQGQTIDPEHFAVLFLDDRFEDPYRKAHRGAELFEANPFTLPARIFSNCFYGYLHREFMRNPNPIPVVGGRFGALDALAWIHTVRVGLHYIVTGANALDQALSTFDTAK